MPSTKHRTDSEYRKCIIKARVSVSEYNELYRYARARKMTVSYLIREALQMAFPSAVNPRLNRYIRPPRKKVADFGGPTHILHSYVDGTTKILDAPPDYALDIEDDDELD